MKEYLSIREMVLADIDILSESFMAQGWPGRKEILRKYFHEQEEGKRQVLIAELGAELAGYITILPIAKHGPFAGRYPELADFNVFEKFQSKGIGRALLEKAVQEAEKFSNVVTLGVGLHHGYGAAQRLYIKSGFIPDGSGVWYNNQLLAAYAPCENNDDLVLYLSKKVK